MDSDPLHIFLFAPQAWMQSDCEALGGNNAEGSDKGLARVASIPELIRRREIDPGWVFIVHEPPEVDAMKVLLELWKHPSFSPVYVLLPDAHDLGQSIWISQNPGQLEYLQNFEGSCSALRVAMQGRTGESKSSEIEMGLSFSDDPSRIQEESRRTDTGMSWREGRACPGESQLYELIRSVGHELRTHLDAMLSALQAFSFQSHHISLGQCRTMDLMDRQCHQMSTIIDSLIDVVQVASGSALLSRELVDLRDLLYQCIDSVRPDMEDRGILASLSIPADHAWIEIDVRHFYQAIRRVLDLIAKRMNAGEVLNVIASPGLETILVRISLGDRTSPARSADVFGGNEIAYMLMSRLLQQHGGRLELTNEGLHFTMPVVPGSIVRLEPNPTPGGNMHGMDLLFIDPNLDALRPLGGVLQRAGHHVRLCTSMSEASEAMEARIPDAVLIDVELASEHLFDLGEQGGPARHASPLMLIGLGNPHDLEGEENPFAYILSKPLRLDELLNLLETIYPRSRAG